MTQRARKEISCAGFLAWTAAVFGGIAALVVGVYLFLAQPWDDQTDLTESTSSAVTTIERGSGAKTTISYAYEYDGSVYLAGKATAHPGSTWRPGHRWQTICLDPDQPERFATMDSDEVCGEGDFDGGTIEAEKFVPSDTEEVTVTPTMPKQRDGRHVMSFTYRHDDPHDEGQQQEYRAEDVSIPASDWKPGSPLKVCVDPDEPAVFVPAVGAVSSCDDEDVQQSGTADVAVAQLYPDDPSNPVNAP